ncbi:uncharacterized protein LOC110831960 [Zootermopsis nevadensis]|nr:uncharacterized protein LOC110831960 [Zootermopsis nevadensis]XP_021924216.1 uncharacterized protein LOC110831960 [Zootermopsis nevadensis]
MASATLKMAFGLFMTWILITELSAQSEICTLKEENAQCVQKSECCSRCCRAGLCANAGECFASCDPNILATAEGPDLCKLTKSIDEFVGLFEITIDEDLAAAIPLLSETIGLAKAFLNDPLTGFLNISNVIKHYQSVSSAFDTSGANIQRIIDTFGTIINEISNIIRKIIPDLQ